MLAVSTEDIVAVLVVAAPVIAISIACIDFIAAPIPLVPANI